MPVWMLRTGARQRGQPWPASLITEAHAEQREECPHWRRASDKLTMHTRHKRFCHFSSCCNSECTTCIVGLKEGASSRHLAASATIFSNTSLGNESAESILGASSDKELPERT
eukprot:Lithocolla_globosa_v1_NODE_4494_length_1422_cov_7.742502.p2 type:complete len:113 gc:universal NODE_4494_length_1422_cov_7.742502:1167-829(-)